MARGHALMGAAVWLGGCAAAGLVADPGTVLTLAAIGTPVCAGWAIVPDIDHPKSTVAHSAGPVSQGVAAIVAAASRLVHAMTKTPWDRDDKDGHRTVTHTFAGAATFGVTVGLAGWIGGPVVAALLVFWPAHLGLAATVKASRRRERFGRGRSAVRVQKSMLLAAALAVGALLLTPGSAWWLGVAAGGGAAIHLLGDMMTDSAVPALWPFVRRDPYGRPLRWQPVGLPRRWRFQTGGAVELVLVHRLLMGLSAAGLLLTAWPILAPVVVFLVQNWSTGG